MGFFVREVCGRVGFFKWREKEERGFGDRMNIVLKILGANIDIIVFAFICLEKYMYFY